MNDQSWIVKIRCTVVKEVLCEGCTEEQAELAPFKYWAEQEEIKTLSYEVLEVKPAAVLNLSTISTTKTQ